MKVACVMVGSTLYIFVHVYIYLRNLYLVDINECITEQSPCRNDQICVNSLGSYLCICSRVGYVDNTLREICEGNNHSL